MSAPHTYADLNPKPNRYLGSRSESESDVSPLSPTMAAPPTDQTALVAETLAKIEAGQRRDRLEKNIKGFVEGLTALILVGGMIYVFWFW